MKISALIITYNEENNIKRAISSLDFCDEIIIIDSFSRDQTVNIAKNENCKIFENTFLGYGEQKNFGLTKCQNDWILSLDADEEISLALKNEIQQYNLDATYNTIFEIPRTTYYCGKAIKHGGWYPDLVVRLFRRSETSFSNTKLHEKVYQPENIIIKKFQNSLNHYSFPTIKSQVLKNLHYASYGASILEAKNYSYLSLLLKILVKPQLKFLECFLFKKGFLDGMRGFIIAVNAMYSIFLKYIFLIEKKLKDCDPNDKI